MRWKPKRPLQAGDLCPQCGTCYRPMTTGDCLTCWWRQQLGAKEVRLDADEPLTVGHWLLILIIGLMVIFFLAEILPQLLLQGGG